MSKKLLMNNYSENGLMPVTDGLICWLDSRDGKSGDSIWIDRSGNGHNAELTNCTWTGNALQIISDSSQCLVNVNPIIDREKPFTIEVCFSRDTSYRNNTSESVIAVNNEKKWHGSTSVYINERRLFYDMGNYTIDANFQSNKTYQIDIIRSDNANRKVFLDSELKHSSATPTNGVSFFGMFLGTKIKGDYYSIKLYNRALTEEEIQQNYLYEQSIERS